MRARGGRQKTQEKKNKIFKVTSRAVAVREDCSKYAPIICSLSNGVYIQSVEEKIVDSVLWIRLSFGWVCSLDNNGFQSLQQALDTEANKAWAQEYDNRRRMCSAIAAELTKSHSLVNARRVTRSILKYVRSNETHQLVNMADVSVDDLIIGLQAATGLRQGEILGFIKIAAASQSNPPRALSDMAEELDQFMCLRPSMWVSRNLNVLETYDLKSANNRFIMAAARNDVREFNQFMAKGQELAALHSELGYTALHAAADFGAIDTLKLLIRSGVSLNIKDCRKGQTALCFAALSGRAEVVKLLLDAGADRTITCYAGLMPYQHAEEQGYTQVREILKFPPPEIIQLKVTGQTFDSISISWHPPTIKPEIHSVVEEFSVEWCPLGDPYVVGHGDRYFMTNNFFTKTGLPPATGHKFMVYSRSPSGWSPPSTKIIHFTLPTKPPAPPPVEVLKVTTNGLLFSWSPPPKDNGAFITFYELEVEDYNVYASKEKAKEDLREAARKKAAAKAIRLDADAGAGGGGRGNGPDTDDVSVMSDDEENEEDEEDSPDEDEGENDNENEGIGMRGRSGGTKTATSAVSDMTHTHTGTQVSAAAAADPTATSAITDGMGGGVTSNEEDASITSSLVSSSQKSLTIDRQSLHHRLVRIKSTKRLVKQIMGLQPGYPYVARVRCKNECGYSKWSEWSPTIAPNAGIQVKEYDSYKGKCRVGWFKPMIAPPRKITAYEIQMAVVTGPLTKSISVFHKEKKPSDNGNEGSRNQKLDDDSGGLPFKTLSNTTVSNEMEINSLKPGGRYMFRVRCCVNSEWVDWDLGMYSEVIVMPASIPDPPFNVVPAPAMSFDDKRMDDEEGGGTEEGKDEADSKKSKDPTQDTNDEVKEVAYDVTHDQITIKWTNGNTNGLPAISYEVNLAKVREYRSNDLNLAHRAQLRGDASTTMKVKNNTDQADTNTNTNTNTTLKPVTEDKYKTITEEASGEEYVHDGIISELPWTDASLCGEMLGPQSFRARGLDSGSSYVFRVRQQNSLGWSEWSKASQLINTFPTLPPGRPRYVRLNYTHVILRWTESVDTRLSLSNLEYSVQVGKLPLVYQNNFSKRGIGGGLSDVNSGGDGEGRREWEATINSMVEWETAATRRWDETANQGVDVDKVVALVSHYGTPMEAEAGCVTVLVDRLSSGTVYVAKVRARTVAGWSAWSEISDCFCTLSAP